MKRSPAGAIRAAIVGFVLLTALAVSTVVLSGCAGELPVPGQMPSTTVGTGPSTSTTVPQTTQLGREVAVTWQEAIQKLLPLIQGTPPADTIQTQVAALKEGYVQKLVTLGHQIAALPGYDRQTAYDRATDTMAGMGGTDWFTSYKDLYDKYAELADQPSQDFAVLLSSFNTLSEYAFFDVLKAQDPAEATRLSIE